MKKVYKIEVRVTKEEKEKYQKLAKEKNMTVSALMINSIESHITLNMNTSDYRDLVIQTRIIGSNINSLLRNIYFTKTFEDTDIKAIHAELTKLDNFVKKEKKRLEGIQREFEDMSIDELRDILISQKERVPLYMEQHGVLDHIRNIILEFKKMLIEHKFDKAYIPFLTHFLKGFNPEKYTREELLDFSDELQTFYNDITSLILNVDKKLTEDDFNKLMEILNKYRKDRDE